MARRAQGANAPRSAPVDAPECTSCGACCFSAEASYVAVFAVDYDRMDERARGFTTSAGRGRFMRMDHGRCAALVVDPVGPRFVCAIYDMRPDCCRALERGGGTCRTERGDKRDRPLLAVAALVRDRAV